MAKMGRPKVEVDQETFEKLCALQCTLFDVSSWFKCSPDTIERWCKETYKETFADTYKKHCVTGKVSLRRKQFEVAMKGNVTMLIWLGKIMLGQRDNSYDVKLFNTEVQGLSDDELAKLATKKLKEMQGDSESKRDN